MLGFGRRRPGDWAAAAVSHVVRWIWMEFISDPLWKSAGITPAFGRSPWDADRYVKSRSDQMIHLLLSKQERVHWNSHGNSVQDAKITYLGRRIHYGELLCWGCWGQKGKYDPFWNLCTRFVYESAFVNYMYLKGDEERFRRQANKSQDTTSGESNLCLLPHHFQEYLMAAVDGGGDQGVVGEMATHPKPVGGSESVPGKAIVVARTVDDQTGESGSDREAFLKISAEELKSKSAHGPEAFTEGVIEEEEEDTVVINLEEEEVVRAGQWPILARLYSLRIPNQTGLFDDMRRAWRLRSDMSYKSLRDNMFIVTFSAEGDYDFVMQGGPWIHKGDALLVASFDGITSPSKVPLDTVPVWVRIYDLPLVLMTKARGELYGSKLGRVREVDVEADGCNKHEFFRVRVDLSVSRPLKTKFAIKMSVQGKEVLRRFDLRYERVPHFCFICGFIGHSDKDCEKKLTNEDQPFQFSPDLRCSPLKPFERRVNRVKADQSSSVMRNLVFRGAGSANSSSSRKKQSGQNKEEIPPMVDAVDGFELREKEGDKTIDELLAKQAQYMNVSGLASQGQGQSGGDEVLQCPAV